MKKIKSILLGSALAVVAGAALVSCGQTPQPTTTTTVEPTTPTVDYKKIVRSILLQQDGKAVSEDFELPTKAAGHDITWKSSDESVVKLVDVEGKKVAGVILPTETKSVTLTATVGTESKEFTVKVNPVTVVQIAENFKFSQKGSILYHTEEGVKLATEAKYEHKSAALAEKQVFTANITWSIPANTTLLSIADNKLMVTDSENKVALELAATFKLPGATDGVTLEYPISVWHKLEGNEQTRYWIDSVGQGEKFDVNGYVIATVGYVDNYKEGNLLVMDSELKGAYYVYNAYIDKDVFNALQGGEPISITGLKSQTYHGLVESNYGATAKVLTAAEATAAGLTKTLDEIDAAKVALDNLLASGARELVYYQNMPVSLTGWELTSDYVAPKTDSSASTTQTLFKIKKGASEVAVVLNKNVTPLDSEDMTELLDGLKTLKKGNFANVEGIYSYYDGHQIILCAGSKANSATKAQDGENFAKTVKTVDEFFKLSYVKDQELTLPTAEGLTYELSLANKSLGYTYKSVKLENGVLTVAIEGHDVTGAELAVGYKEEVDLVAKLVATIGDEAVSATLTKTFTVAYLSAAEQLDTDLADAVEKYGVDLTKKAEYTLPTEGEVFGSTLTWTLVSPTEGTVATLANGVLTVNPSATETEVKVKVAGVNGTASKEVEFTFKAIVGPADLNNQLKAVRDITTLKDGDTIVLASQDGKKIQSAMAENGNFLTVVDFAGTFDAETMTTFTLVKNGDFWNLKLGDKYLYAPCNGNNVKVRDEVGTDGAANWAITITDGVLSIVSQSTASGGQIYLRWNAGSPRFSCYKSSSSVQESPWIFVQSPANAA